MSKFNPPIDDAVKKGADIISFGARRAERVGLEARNRATLQGFDTTIPGAESFSRLLEVDQLLDLTSIKDFETLGVIDNDILYRVYRALDTDDETMQYIDESLNNILNVAPDEYVPLPGPPQVTGRWNPETLDIELVVDEQGLAEAGIFKGLQTANPKLYDRPGIPFKIDWESAPWEFADDGEWAHSGRVRFVTEEGNEIATIRSDEMQFPFDPEFKARRDPEASAQWWSNNPVPAWMASGRATSRYQPTTQRETEEFLRMAYSPDATRWFDALKTGDEVYKLVDAGDRFIAEAGINLTKAQQELRNNNSVEFVYDLMSGIIDPRVSAEGVMDFLEDAPRIRSIYDGRARRAGELANQAALKHAADEMIQAPLDRITNHFNQYMLRVKAEDPRRFQAMLDFVGDSPYRQGVVWPGSENGELPMLIFHSGRSLNLEKMGRPGVEMPQFLAPHETALHAGDLQAASDIGGYSVVTSHRTPTGIAAKPYRDEVIDNQVLLDDRLKRTLPSNMYGAYKEIARGVHEQTLDVMLDMYGTGTLKFPDPGSEIVRRLDPELAKLLDVRPRDLEPELLEELVRQYLKNPEEALRSRSYESDLQGLVFGMKEHANQAWKTAHRATWPLVFRGKRPFRLADVSSNTPQNWAREALHYPVFKQNDDWRTRLEAIAESANWASGSSREMTEMAAEATRDFREVLEEAGFDHIIYTNRVENVGHPSIVFWDQSLAKPLYGSKGFDPNSKSWANSVLASPLFGLQEQRSEDNGN